MRKVKAAVMTDFNKPLETWEFPKPKPYPNSVLVKVEMAGICGTDVKTWHGWVGGKSLNFPFIPGHETIGTIEELGEGDIKSFTGEKLSIGDRVTFPTTMGTYCYRCYNCVVAKIPNKCLNRLVYGSSISCKEPPHLFGGWAEYIYLIPKTSIIKVPKEVPAEVVIASGCAAPTMIHALERANLRWGDTVLIQGSGGVGLLGLAVARESGAGKVIVIGAPESRLKVAEGWSADYTINIQEVKDPAKRVDMVKELSGGYGVDVVFECSGVPTAFPEGIQMCRDGGTYVVVGQFMDVGPVEMHPFWITSKHMAIAGCYSFEAKHVYRAVDFLASVHKKYPFKKLVTHKYPIEKATEALLATDRLESVKSVLVPALSREIITTG